MFRGLPPKHSVKILFRPGSRSPPAGGTPPPLIDYNQALNILSRLMFGS